MTSRFGQLGAVLLLLAALLLPAAVPAKAHTESPTHYSSYCTGAPSGMRYGDTWERGDAQGVNPLTDVRGNVVARDLHPCSQGDTGYHSASLILPANIQGWEYNNQVGTFNFVQAGIAKVDYYSDTVCDGQGALEIPDNTNVFVFTPSPTSGGAYCRAWWVDYNNDGTPDNPIAGHTYQFSINEYDIPSGDRWNICVKDVVTSQNDCYQIVRTTDDGGLDGGDTTAWWGCEVESGASAEGTNGSGSPATLSWTGYVKASGGGWTYTENSNVHSSWNGSPSYYDINQSQVGTGEQVDCYTTSHTS